MKSSHGVLSSETKPPSHPRCSNAQCSGLPLWDARPAARPRLPAAARPAPAGGWSPAAAAPSPTPSGIRPGQASLGGRPRCSKRAPATSRACNAHQSEGWQAHTMGTMGSTHAVASMLTPGSMCARQPAAPAGARYATRRDTSSRWAGVNQTVGLLQHSLAWAVESPPNGANDARNGIATSCSVPVGRLGWGSGPPVGARQRCTSRVAVPVTCKGQGEGAARAPTRKAWPCGPQCTRIGPVSGRHGSAATTAKPAASRSVPSLHGHPTASAERW